MPITWRNVNAPNFGASNRLLQSGQEAIQRSFQGLANLSGDITEDNRNQATEEALSRIASVGSLEDFETARDTGLFDTSSLGKSVDQAKIRKALKTRGTELGQQQTLANQREREQVNHLAFQREQEQRPIRQNSMNLVAEGKFQEAIAAAEGLSDKTGVLDAIKRAQRANTKAEREKIAFNEEQAQRLAAPELAEQELAIGRQLTTIDDNYSQVVNDYPVTRNVTTEEEAIKQGDVIESIKSNFSNAKENLDLNQDEIDEIDAGLKRITSKTFKRPLPVKEGEKARSETLKYPGWVLEQAFKTVGFEGGIFRPGFFDDEVAMEALEEEADKLMQTYLKDKANIDKVRQAKQFRDSNRTEVLSRQLRDTQAILNKHRK